MTLRMFRVFQLFVMCFLVFSASASANNFNYHYFEFRVGSSPESLGVEYNFPITDNFYFIGRTDSQFKHDGDIAGGVGFAGPLSDFVDIYGQALSHFIDYPNEGGNHKSDDVLLELNLGARVWLLSQLEGYARLGTMHNHTTSQIGFMFHSTDQLSFGAGFVNNGIWGPQIMMNVRALF